jgi:hypothetical protein
MTEDELAAEFLMALVLVPPAARCGREAELGALSDGEGIHWPAAGEDLTPGRARSFPPCAELGPLRRRMGAMTWLVTKSAFVGMSHPFVGAGRGSRDLDQESEDLQRSKEIQHATPSVVTDEDPCPCRVGG